jgi:hypothetical protein
LSQNFILSKAIAQALTFKLHSFIPGIAARRLGLVLLFPIFGALILFAFAPTRRCRSCCIRTIVNSRSMTTTIAVGCAIHGRRRLGRHDHAFKGHGITGNLRQALEIGAIGFTRVLLKHGITPFLFRGHFQNSRALVRPLSLSSSMMMMRRCDDKALNQQQATRANHQHHHCCHQCRSIAVLSIVAGSSLLKPPPMKGGGRRGFHHGTCTCHDGWSKGRGG